ncbi:hypothetical protein ZWY2020_010154 [Hordeum vulgare]|nr:hypothetical protein ZWY2020_010154 [Hordeum vulgare]
MGVFAETVTALVWMVGLFPTVALAVFTVTNMAPVSLQFFPPSPAGLPSAPLPPYPAVPLPQLPSPQSPVPPSPLLLDSSIVCAPPHAVIPSPPVSAAAASLVCPASPAPLTDLTADQLKFKIASWGRLALMFLSITFILIGIVGPQVEAAAKAEARAASEEDKAYKEAKEALIEAMYAVDAATREIDTAVDKCISDLQMRVSDLITNDHLFSLMFGINKVIGRKHKVLEKEALFTAPLSSRWGNQPGLILSRASLYLPYSLQDCMAIISASPISRIDYGEAQLSRIADGSRIHNRVMWNFI